jgi:D-alanyl-D-alanine carboxypeptidase/D-alanyl-D-alanine-endopeptidase (penicillin-binding protein 4)
VLLAVAAGALVWAQTTPQRIDAALKASGAASRGFWGIHVVSVSTGRTLYQLEPDRYFVPASTAKLFSTALALERLGPDYRFVTLITADQAPDASGRLSGDLRLVGGGDPTLSGRPIPYRKGAAPGNPLRAIEELADLVVARGVRRIDGNIVGDDSAYLWEPFPVGWAQDDATWDFGAPVSALSVNENRIALSLRPGPRAGDPAVIRLSPPLEYFIVENRVRTTAAGERKIEIERLPGSRQVRVWGAVPLKSDPVSWLLAIDDPAQFAAVALSDALSRRGVAVSGRPVARHRFAAEAPDRTPEAAPVRVELARRVSPPLVEILQVADKESVNLYAEMVLREVARARRGLGSVRGGLDELAAFLKEAGLSERQSSLVDASGLSTSDLVTPRALTTLLAFMHRSAGRDAWMSLLPVAGQDGTLSQRFTSLPPTVRIIAKTGTTTHVSALAGYIRTGGDTLAFSILVNNFTAPVSEIRQITDKIVVLLTQ